MNASRNDSLRKALPRWCGNNVRTADALGGRVMAYADSKKQLSVRALQTVGAQFEKTVSIIADSSPSVMFRDNDETSATPSPLQSDDVRSQLMQLLPPSAVVRVSELPPKVSGPVATLVLELKAGSTLSSELCARLLCTPRVVDVKVSGTKIYVMQAKPSQVRTSLDYIGNAHGFRVRERPAGKAPARKRRKLRRKPVGKAVRRWGGAGFGRS
ncbi:MAG: hypothetical protein CL678_01165 [Bdellovibrionaceae bacterium]|nr:hypothetical protein [Pseudobdellovibrionaceae bacterium]